MELFSAGGRKRETYEVEVKNSLLWETALGIAAVTNQSLIDTLDYSKNQWQEMKQSLSKDTLAQLEIVEERNTWKTILLLLHEEDFETLDGFFKFVESLDEEKLRYIGLPYLGRKQEEDRKLASQGDSSAVERLQVITEEHAFFKDYITFMSKVDTEYLKQHIQKMVDGWYAGVVRPQKEYFEGILERDAAVKQQMRERLDPEAFVEWATKGVHYSPEPSVFKVILIPQFIYRPWNVEADLEGAKVFYYPVANESIYPEDPYVPDQTLVQKFKALGDDNRLRMMKILMSGGRTLQEMTEEVGMGKTTVYHHLKLLKSARLIQSYGPRYHVNPRAWESMPQELDMYFGERK